MTALSEVIGSAMVLIDDVRLAELLEGNPAAFYRKMAQYADMAAPMLKSPPELLLHVMQGRVAPACAAYEWTSTQESTLAPVQVSTGLTGYDVAGAVIHDGEATAYSGRLAYDSATGVITFPVQEKAGLEYDIDLYRDGSYADISASQMRLFALAISLVWYERFENNWLNQQPKINDASFTTVNEANYIDKLSAKAQRKRREFTDELAKYEQSNAYLGAVDGRTGTLLI